MQSSGVLCGGLAVTLMANKRGPEYTCSDLQSYPMNVYISCFAMGIGQR